MSKLKNISVISAILILSLGTICFAKNDNLKQITNQDIISVQEVSNYKNSIKQEITSDGIDYKLINVDQIENKKQLEKQKEIQEELIVLSNNKDAVLNQFEKSKKISEDGYEGILNIQTDSLDIKVNESYQEEYKVYIQKTYENVTSNELNDIPKEIEMGGTTYYLINPVWNVISTEKVGNHDVPLTYTGIMYYEGVKVRTVVKNYKATIKYEGMLTKEVVDSVTLISTYQEIPKEINNIAPVLVTTSSIIFFSGIIIIKRKNVKIYNYANNKYRLVKRIRVNKDNPFMDITPLRVTSNRYKIVLSNKIYNELKNCSVRIKYFDKYANYIISEKEFEINA